MTTTLPESSVSRIERKADFKITETGALEGRVTVTFTGLEALWRRIDERNADKADRKKFLEDQVKEYIPVGIDVELTNNPDWAASSQTLVAEYDVKVAGWISGAGRRALLPVGIFSGPEKHVFEHANRVHPIYYSFPLTKIDDVRIELPLSWQVSSLPPPQNQDAHAIVYTLKVDKDKGSLHLVRQLNVNMIMVEAKYYSMLRNFYQTVRTGDEQQIVLQPGAASAQN